jgi:hypothetical protein
MGYPLGVLAGEAARWPDLDALPWLSRGLLQAWSAEEAYIIDARRDPFIYGPATTTRLWRRHGP